MALCGWTGRGGQWTGVSTRRGFFLGLLTGVVHYAGTVYWTSATVSTFGGLPWVIAIPVAGLLVLYMALFVAGAAAAGAIMIRRLGTAGLLLTPAAWVAAEYLRAHLFGGFPWIPLGNAVVTLPPIAQAASLVGVFGLSWLLATLHACLAVAATRTGRTRLAAAGAAFLLVAVPSGWGAARIADGRLTRAGTPLTVALIQGNIPQLEKWDPARAPSIYQRYQSMSRQARSRGAEFIIWPESATPFFFDEEPRQAEQLRQLARDLQVPILFGTDEIDPGESSRYYNSAFLVASSGATAAVYRKMHLVPFGEYVPFAELLFFVAPLVEGVGAFSPGLRVTMLPVNGHMASTAICYEVVYPHLIREGVLNGSELLTTITNDAWYGSTSAPFQHWELASMRAIEQGRYLARAANTGISGIVDPYGRVLAKTALFETATVVGEVRLIQERTVYATIGDLAAQLAVLLTLLGVGTALWRPRVTRA